MVGEGYDGILGGIAVFSFAQVPGKLSKKAIPRCGTITDNNTK